MLILGPSLFISQGHVCSSFLKKTWCDSSKDSMVNLGLTSKNSEVVQVTGGCGRFIQQGVFKRMWNILHLLVYNMFHGKMPSALDLVRAETTLVGFYENNSYISKSKSGPSNPKWQYYIKIIYLDCFLVH